jgi:TM2 domain-containing membrane protein YozV
VNAHSIQFSVPAKSTGVAYLLWFFFGGIGAHKFYLGRPGIGALYIGMFVLFWAGTLSLLGLAIDARHAVAIAAQQGHSSGLFEGGWSPGIVPFVAPATIAPLSLALLYDLVTLPSQVHAANARLGSQQAFGGSSAGSGSMFGGADRDAELSAKKADELVARYIARQSQSAAQAGATRPAQAGPTQPAQAGTPTFGRRGR